MKRRVVTYEVQCFDVDVSLLLFFNKTVAQPVRYVAFEVQFKSSIVFQFKHLQSESKKLTILSPENVTYHPHGYNMVARNKNIYYAIILQMSSQILFVSTNFFGRIDTKMVYVVARRANPPKQQKRVKSNAKSQRIVTPYVDILSSTQKCNNKLCITK